jgi:hypothetical protein
MSCAKKRENIKKNVKQNEGERHRKTWPVSPRAAAAVASFAHATNGVEHAS